MGAVMRFVSTLISNSYKMDGFPKFKPYRFMSLHVLPRSVDPSSTYIGKKATPQAMREKRSQYPHRLNDTISASDRVFAKSVKTRTLEETKEAKDPVATSEKYEEMIRDHINRRVAIFFQQLVCCYNTRLHFEIGRTLHQGESATSVQLVDHNNKKSKLCVRNAAHSSTLPCLVAYDGGKWKRYKEQNGPKPEGFIYINDSDTYKRANSTLEMPRDINEADIEIDGNEDSSILRSKSIALINEVSMGKKEPQEALEDFLKEITKLSKDKAQTARKRGVKKALEYFADELKELKQASKTPVFYENLLGVRVDANETSSIARKTVYKLRFQAIRKDQMIQSEILGKIDAVRSQVLAAVKNGRTPTYFEDAFRDLLTEKMRTDQDRMRLKKLFSSTEGHYFRETPSRRTTYEKTKRLVEGQLPLIETLAGDLQVDFRSRKREEILARGKITRVLRNAKGLTQTELAAQIKAIFPNAVASQPTISRIERNERIIDKAYAKELAKAFKVDPGLFLPAYFLD